ncbi:MAG: hypothetical protein JWS12_544 [Candidatus Saccharibacteria bacterium]|nr:hypothetical protein [Candidatus Saccharibacteria bacterium]
MSDDKNIDKDKIDLMRDISDKDLEDFQKSMADSDSE